MIYANDNKGDWDAHLVPGAGTIDWTRIVHELANTNFRGTVIHELAGGEGVSHGEMLDRARHGRQFLQDILPKGGRSRCATGRP